MVAAVSYTSSASFQASTPPSTLARKSSGQHMSPPHVVGANSFRCYVADAETHHRAYLIELMGRDGGCLSWLVM